MTVMQIILLVASAFFAFKIYEHAQGLQDPDETQNQPQEETIDIEALVEEADKAYDAGHLLEARELLKQAHEHDRSIPELSQRLGFIMSKMGNHDESLKLYKHSLSLLLEEEDVIHLAIASELKALGRLDEAEEHYKRAIELDDKYEVTYFNYANLLVEMKRIAEAKMMYEHALEIEPDLEAAKEELERLNA